jgi:hypothetical protein
MTTPHIDSDRYTCNIIGDTAHLDLWYPTVNSIKAIQIGLMDVRAANSIRITYDHKRDGWVISMATVHQWDFNDPVCDPCFQEVAFIHAWAVGGDEPQKTLRG